MQKLPLILATIAAFAITSSAFAAAPPLAVKAKAAPAKLSDCEHAWAAQRIKKGSHRAFIRACVRHG